MLFRDYILYWYQTYKEPVQELNTAAVNLCYLRVHVVPSSLGQKELSVIRTHDIQEFLADLLLQGNRCPIKSINTYGKPLSRWTVNRIRQLLIAALNSAVKEGLIPFNCAVDTTPDLDVIEAALKDNPDVGYVYMTFHETASGPSRSRSSIGASAPMGTPATGGVATSERSASSSSRRRRARSAAALRTVSTTSHAGSTLAASWPTNTRMPAATSWSV